MLRYWSSLLLVLVASDLSHLLILLATLYDIQCSNSEGIEQDVVKVPAQKTQRGKMS